jgi:hypothetical protein
MVTANTGQRPSRPHRQGDGVPQAVPQRHRERAPRAGWVLCKYSRECARTHGKAGLLQLSLAAVPAPSALHLSCEPQPFPHKPPTPDTHLMTEDDGR